jgi:tungstate transport system permease protein
MVIAQVLLITPIVAANTETFLAGVVPELRETSKGMNFGFGKTLWLTILESKYQIVSTYLVGFARSIAEVGAVSMVGGAIVYKTNVMTTAIMNYTSRGNFSKAMAIGIILMTLSLIVNIIVHLLSERVVDER